MNMTLGSLIKLIRIICGVITIIVGIVVAFVFTSQQQELALRCTEPTVATVSSCEEKYRQDDDPVYEVALDYEAGGRKYRHKMNSSSKYDVGEQLNIKYDPDEPTECVLNGAERMKPVMMIFGGVIILIGVGIILSAVFSKRY